MEQLIILKCCKCGTVYDFTKDAYVEYSMTMAEVSEFQKSQQFQESQGTITIVGSYTVLPEEAEKGSLLPDKVYIGCKSPLPKSELNRLLREELDKIEKSLAKGQKREWRCSNCGTVQRYRS